MRKVLEVAGFLLMVVGISGTIDHLAVQPIFGFLNVLNRFVFPDLVPGHELFANLITALLGFLIMVAAARTKPD